jgi:predicted alpha/beta-hydrolase family hydrolase
VATKTADLATTKFSFDVGSSRTTAIFYGAAKPGATLLLGHGAGAPQTHPWMVSMAGALSARGVDVVTFNFLYAEARKRVPDRNDVLEATWRAAIDAASHHCKMDGKRLYAGGKSMGGRIATQVAAKHGGKMSGLVLLGYPLHPPGKPTLLRSSHLPRVEVPMLFVQGSRDVFGTPEELRPIVEQLAVGSRLFVVDGGDHSLSRPKSAGEPIDTTLGRVADEVVRFTGAR